MFPRILKKIASALFSIFLATVAILFVGYLSVAPELPSVNDLKNIQLQTPLRVYTRDGRLLGEFGEKRRVPAAMGEIPKQMVDAFLAAEDDRFFEHPGVDYEGLLRAVIKLIETGEKRQGGSTITMQLARNYFLTSERTYTRKIKEIFLALLIERRFNKEEILQLYLNKIFLGHRAYGVGAAAEVYYGAVVRELTLAQIAMIAGLPKAPSIYNPLRDPTSALERRNYVLNRMLELEMIEESEHGEAMAAEITAKWHGTEVELSAPYVAEMVRREAIKRFGDEAYTEGYEIHTTIDSELQVAADRAVEKTLTEYDLRHGYRGVEGRVGEDEEGGEAVGKAIDEEGAREALLDLREIGGLLPAVVTKVTGETFYAVVKDGETEKFGPEAYSWARKHVDPDERGDVPSRARNVVSAGDIVRVAKVEDKWKLRQLPNVGGALVALEADTGAILALDGGFDFLLSKFNRAVQARRQPGSSFKPFIYAAALAHGYTPASIVNDSPVVFTDIRTKLDWRPANYSGKFFGPTRLREALKHSRNLVSIRLVDSMSVRDTLDYILRFGFDRADQQYDLTLSLGSGTVTPLQLAGAFTAFPNAGAQIAPYLIDEIRTSEAQLYKADPLAICAENCDPEVSEALDLAVTIEIAEEEEGDEEDDKDKADDKVDEEADEEAAAAAAKEAAEEAAAAAAKEAAEEAAAAAAKEAGEEAAKNYGVLMADLAVDEDYVVLPPKPGPAPRVIPSDVAYQINSMMQDVIRGGTGRRARVLGRSDLAGKTGTTNDQRDAWFSGFSRDIVCTTWIGFDDHSPLGRHETGSRAALPMWIEFMKTALKKRPQRPYFKPENIVTADIDAETGLLAHPDDEEPIVETFRVDLLPEEFAGTSTDGEKEKGIDKMF